MRYALKTVLLTNQEAVVRNYGDKIWEWLCDTYSDSFKPQHAADICPITAHLAPRVRGDYMRVILRNVEDEYRDDWESRPFERVGNKLIRWR